MSNDCLRRLHDGFFIYTLIRLVGWGSKIFLKKKYLDMAQYHKIWIPNPRHGSSYLHSFDNIIV